MEKEGKNEMEVVQEEVKKVEERKKKSKKLNSFI